MKTLTSLLCLKCPNVFPPHSHWVKVPIMASKVLSGLDYLSDLSFSHLSSDTEGISHPGSWSFLEHSKNIWNHHPNSVEVSCRYLPGPLLHFFGSLLKCHIHHPTTMDYPVFVAWFFPVAVVIMIFIYFTNVLYLFVYYLIPPHSLITLWNISSSG